MVWFKQIVRLVTKFVPDSRLQIAMSLHMTWTTWLLCNSTWPFNRHTGRCGTSLLLPPAGSSLIRELAPANISWCMRNIFFHARLTRHAIWNALHWLNFERSSFDPKVMEDILGSLGCFFFLFFAGGSPVGVSKTKQRALSSSILSPTKSTVWWEKPTRTSNQTKLT